MASTTSRWLGAATRSSELKDPILFKQEYPATAAEAFQMSGHDSYIPPALVAKARKASAKPSGPLVIGFDPAWMGGDRHSMAGGRGAVMKVESRSKLDTMQAAGWLKQVIDGRSRAGVRRRGRRWCWGLRPAHAHGRALFERIVRRSTSALAAFEPPPLDEHGKPSRRPAQSPR
jgi:hypothetical protein